MSYAEEYQATSEGHLWISPDHDSVFDYIVDSLAIDDELVVKYMTVTSLDQPVSMYSN